MEFYGFMIDANNYINNSKERRKQLIRHITRQNDAAKIAYGLACDDVDAIEKVEGAGELFSSPESGSYQLMHNGIKVVPDAYCGVWMREFIRLLRGHHEPQEEKVFHEVLQAMPKQATMIELGSWWGYYSLWFASKVAESTNYLIEPSLERLEVGKKNFALNQKKGIFIQGHCGRVIPTEEGNNFTGSQEIHIDSFLETAGIDHLHILHSDIQGAEVELVRTCAESIRQQKIDYYFISTHSDPIHQDCLHYLMSQGLLIVAEHSVLESFTDDGVIVAKRRGALGPDRVAISKNGTTCPIYSSK